MWVDCGCRFSPPLSLTLSFPYHKIIVVIDIVYRLFLRFIVPNLFLVSISNSMWDTVWWIQAFVQEFPKLIFFRVFRSQRTNKYIGTKHQVESAYMQSKYLLLSILAYRYYYTYMRSTVEISLGTNGKSSLLPQIFLNIAHGLSKIRITLSSVWVILGGSFPYPLSWGLKAANSEVFTNCTASISCGGRERLYPFQTEWVTRSCS